MKYLLSLTFLALIALSACNNNKFTINGKIENMAAQPFYLEENAVSGKVIIDSGKTNADGTFAIDGETTEPNLYRLRFARGKYIMLTLHNEKVNVTGDWNKLEEYDVTGSAGSTSLKNLLVALRAHVRDVNTLDMVTKSFGNKSNKDSLIKEVGKSLQVMNKDFASYVKNFADTTTLVPNAVFAANLINPQVDVLFIEKFYTNLPKRFPKSKIAGEFLTLYNSKKSSTSESNNVASNDTNNVRATAKVETASKYVSPPDAKAAPDFTAATPAGNEVRLSSFKGKFVLIDFWASWCGPCRQENPNVVAAYQKFKDKNFTILGVSLDDSQEKWVEAIAADGLEWTNISDLKKWGSVPARAYNINSIPANFLVDPNGNIIAQNMRGAALEAKLSEVLK